METIDLRGSITQTAQALLQHTEAAGRTDKTTQEHIVSDTATQTDTETDRQTDVTDPAPTDVSKTENDGANPKNVFSFTLFS